MRPTPRQNFPPARSNRSDSAPLWLAAILIALAAVLAYSNSFSGPFVEDDLYAVTSNPSIHHLWPVWDALSPPPALTVGGRPLLNFTFALNYAISGEDTWSYHAFNLLVHILAALALFGVVRRTLLLPVLRDRFGAESLPLATVIAILWVLHPAQTETVTYISQRSESLMGLCYFLTLYGFIRATSPSANQRLWFIVTLLACSLGMSFKEVMVTAPVMVLLYDRTFVAGTFHEAWRKRWWLYAGLVATCAQLVYSLLSVSQRAVGLKLGVTPWTYALTECRAIVHYLALIIWPHPLIFDHGNAIVTDPLQVLPEALVVLALLAVTILALARRSLLGFVGAWFFLILAPTSSFIPIVKSPIADHRLYLPLAGVITLGVLTLYTLLGKKSLWVLGALALAWSVLTFARNEDYRSALQLWEVTVAQDPANGRAHLNYGASFIQAGRLDEAIAQLTLALQIDPKDAEAQNDYGLALNNLRRPDAAIPHFKEALRLKSDYAAAHNNWGNALLQMNRLPEAIVQFRDAMQIDPNFIDARNGLAVALARSGQVTEAIRQLEEVLRIDPTCATARDNLAQIKAVVP